jgi:hypothetical protein
VPEHLILCSVDLSGLPHHWMRGRPAVGVKRAPACGACIHPSRWANRLKRPMLKVRLACNECQQLLEAVVSEGREEYGQLG